MQLPQPRRRQVGEPVIPLINIVFLLLIFFMLAGTFTAPEPFAVDPPEARSGDAAEDEHGVVLLGANGALAFEGKELDGLDALERLVASRLEAEPGLALRLKADGDAASLRLLDVMDRLRTAGAERLLLLTAEAPE